MLGSSGHLLRPSEGVRASYSACLPPEHTTNHHVKVIANLAFTTATGENPHTFTYAPGKTAVNELHEVSSLPSIQYLNVRHKKVAIGLQVIVWEWKLCMSPCSICAFDASMLFRVIAHLDVVMHFCGCVLNVVLDHCLFWSSFAREGRRITGLGSQSVRGTVQLPRSA